MGYFGDAVHPMEGPLQPDDKRTQPAPEPDPNGVLKIRSHRLRAEFTNRKRDGILDPATAIKGVLQAIMSVNPETSVQELIGTESFNDMTNFPKEENEQKRFFNVEFDNRPGSRKVVIEFRIVSSWNLATYKRSKFMEYLKKENIRMNVHIFASLKLSSAGYFIGKSTKHTWYPHFEAELREALAECTDNETLEEVPLFEIAPKPQHYNNWQTKEHFSTYALDIQCQTEQLDELKNLLLKYGDQKDRFGEFVLKGVTHGSDLIYPDSMRRQNAYAENTTKVTVFGLHPEVMASYVDQTTTLHEKLMSVVSDKGERMIYTIESTQLTSSHGKYFFICDKKHEEELTKFIDAMLAQTYKTASAHHDYEDEYLPDFPAPRRSQKALNMEDYVRRKQAEITSAPENAINNHRAPPRQQPSIALNPKAFPPIRINQKTKNSNPDAWKTVPSSVTRTQRQQNKKQKQQEKQPEKQQDKNSETRNVANSITQETYADKTSQLTSCDQTLSQMEKMLDKLHKQMDTQTVAIAALQVKVQDQDRLTRDLTQSITKLTRMSVETTRNINAMIDYSGLTVSQTHHLHTAVSAITKLLRERVPELESLPEIKMPASPPKFERPPPPGPPLPPASMSIDETSPWNSRSEGETSEASNRFEASDEEQVDFYGSQSMDDSAEAGVRR